MRRYKTSKFVSNLLAISILAIIGTGIYLLILIASFLDWCIAQVRKWEPIEWFIAWICFVILILFIIKGIQLYCRWKRLRYEEMQKQLQEKRQHKLLLKASMDKLQNMDPFDFEHYVADVFRQLGYQAKVSPRTNDGGKDIILTKDGKVGYVEVKKYNQNHKIGRRHIQILHSAMNNANIDFGYFVTLSDFAKTAIEYAKDKNIALINGEELLVMIHKTSLAVE